MLVASSVPTARPTCRNGMGSFLGTALAILAVFVFFPFLRGLWAPYTPPYTPPASAPATGTIIDVEREAPPHEYQPLDKKELAVLGKYDYVFVLDRSGSMESNDCHDPKDESKVYTRWSWGSRELESFAKLAETALPSGFTVLTFNDRLDRYENRNRNDLAEIYKSTGPEGGTLIAPAFRSAIRDQEKSTKPLAIVVLSDGEPSDADELRDEIVEATKGKERVHIEMLSIAAQEASLLKNLDEHLVGAGAAYDAVHVAPFDDVAKNGIAHSLAKTLAAEESNTEASQPSAGSR
jgi:hypothetical protein